MTHVIAYTLICIFGVIAGLWFASLDDGQRALNALLSAGFFSGAAFALWRVAVILS
jgi:predicted outer membrane lipoprotein